MTGFRPTWLRQAVSALMRTAPTPFRFASLSSYTLSLAQDTSVDVLVTVRFVNNTETVTPEVSSLPTGVTGTFTPPTVSAASPTTTLRMTAGPTAPAIVDDQVVITIPATAAVPAVVINAALTVIAPTVTPAIAISASPTSTSAQQGSTATTTVTVARTAYVGDVTLTAVGLGAGASIVFVPNPLTGAVDTSVATLTNALDASPIANDGYVIAGNGTGVLEATQAMQHSITAIGSGPPAPSGSIVLDGRAGGPDDWQACSNYAQLRTATLAPLGGAANTGNGFQSVPFTGMNVGYEFTDDWDGSGTRALVSNLGGWGETLIASVNVTRAAGTSTATPFQIKGLGAGRVLAADTKLAVARAGVANWELAEVASDATADGSGIALVTLKATNAASWGSNAVVNITLANSETYPDKGYYRELGNKIFLNLQSRNPTELFIRYTLQQGRNVGGPGFDHAWRTSGPDRSSVPGEYVVQNEELFNDGTGPSASGQNASRKLLLMTRAPSTLGGGGRYDVIFAGSVTTGTLGSGTVSITYDKTTDTGSATFSASQTLSAGKLIRVGPGSNQHLYEIVSGSGTSYAIKSRYLKERLAASLTTQSFWITDKRAPRAQINNNKTGSGVAAMPNTPASVQQSLGSTAFRIENAIGVPVVYTKQFVASSSETAADGIFRMWADNELILEATNLAYGNYPFRTIEMFGSTFNSPRQNQTEAFWDPVIWIP